MQEAARFLVGFFARQVESNLVSITIPPQHLSRKIGQTTRLKRKKINSSALGEIIAGSLRLLYDQQAMEESKNQCLT